MGDYRTVEETMAAHGETLLRKSDDFKQADESHLPVPVLVERIWHRPSHAVAPHGHTCPFTTTEEWSTIRMWIMKHDGAEHAGVRFVAYQKPHKAVHWDGTDKALAEIKQIVPDYQVTRQGEDDILHFSRTPWGWNIHIGDWLVVSPVTNGSPFVVSDYDFRAQFTTFKGDE